MAESGKIISQTEGVPTPAQERASGNTPGQKAALSKRAFNRAVADATELTDWNDHNRAVRTFTKFFKYNDLTAKMEGIINTHEDLGHMPANLIEERRKIMDTMFTRIRNDYGDDVWRKVHSAL